LGEKETDFSRFPAEVQTIPDDYLNAFFTDPRHGTRQPHPDPNYAPHTAARLLAVALRGLIDTPLLVFRSG